MRAAVQTIPAAVGRGARICVHGDYDADGICATALAVLLLRELGAEPHGTCRRASKRVTASSARRSRGSPTTASTSCSPSTAGSRPSQRSRRRRRLGLEVVVTDHHRPARHSPIAPSSRRCKGDYPFAGLCGTGVVWKLAQAILGPEHPFCDRHLDVVALATIADVVPLVDENRALARRGLRRLAQTQKPGLRALMRIAGVDPAAVDEGAVGFRLAPRINAAGRLCRPEAALHLLLSEDRREADRLADELEELNRERQGVEERIVRAAVDASSRGPRRARRRGVRRGGRGLARGRDRDRRLAARRAIRPARRADRRRGSRLEGLGPLDVRSFDLHGALAACSAYLERFGGHRAAAGLSIRPERVEAFAAAFAAHADAALADADLRPRTRIDAIVRGSRLGLDLCAELGRLAPFGLGNPGVTLLVDGCELTELATVGDGKHLRFRVRHHGYDAGGAIAFGIGAQLDRFRRSGRYDVAFRLQENRWNGTVAPQLLVRRIFDSPEGYEDLRTWLAAQWREGRAGVDGRGTRDLRRARARRRRERGALLESEAFRRLLEEGAAPLAAAA